VLFVCGPTGDARRYRCDHQREQLEHAGLGARVVYRDGLRLASLADRDVTVVLFRVPWDDDVARLVDAARERAGTVVLADVDDLVFDPDRAHLIGGVDLLGDAERRAYLAAVEALGRTVAEVDGVLVSTDALAEEVARVNARVGVAYNVVSAEMVERGLRAAEARRGSDGVVLAYLSGTATHDRDLREAGEALVWALEQHAEARLLTVGPVQLDPRLEAFGDRVVRLPLVPWRELGGVLARVDVNLAPLERGNRFTECKSCVKYLEAALVRVPTVASPRPDFARVIEHGVNGLLADDTDAWRRALDELIRSPARRDELGRAAHADVLARSTTAARAEATAAVVRSLAAR
jgi:glycosyltransferase involved in cell wall biosynthesis